MKKLILFCLLLLLLSVDPALAADYYFDKRCTNNGDGSADTCAAAPGGVGAWNVFNTAGNKANTPPPCTFNFVEGSGPYYPSDFTYLNVGYLYSNHNAGVVTWDFHGNRVQMDINVNDGSYEWHQSTNCVTTWYLTGAGGANPNINDPKSVIVNGSWSAETTNLAGSITLYGRYATDNWRYANLDALGFNTLYVIYNGGTDPTGGNPIMVPTKPYVAYVPFNTVTYVIRDGYLSGATHTVINAAGKIEVYGSRLQNADLQGILIDNAGATGWKVSNTIFDGCGHRGVNLNAQASGEMYHNDFIDVHLELLMASNTAYEVIFRNNASKNLLAGGIQHDNATPTLTEDHNQFRVDPATTHGNAAISFTGGVRQWTTTAATDIPASADTSVACPGAGCGTDPLLNAELTPQPDSPLINAGASGLGVTTDYDGRPIRNAPDIGAKEYQAPEIMFGM